MSFNRIQIVGNLGRDPETRNLPDGTPVTTFPLASNERTKNGDVTTWFRINLFGKSAELAAQHLTKGREVYVEGSVRQDNYTDKDGKERTTLDVRANNFQFIGAKADGDGAPRAAAAGAGMSPVQSSTTTTPPSVPASGGDDIPF